MEKDVKKLYDDVNTKLDGIKSSIETKAALEDFNALKTSIEDMAEKGASKEDINAEFAKVNDILEKQGNELQNLIKGNVAENSFHKNFEANKKSIDKMMQNRSGQVTLLEQKAVGDVTTSNVATGTFGGQAIYNTNNANESNRGNLFRDLWIEQYATVGRINRPNYSYVDWKPKDGDAATVAEGGTKPQIDFQSTVTGLTPTKVAAYEALTEESVTDVVELESVARDILMNKVMLKRQANILANVISTASAFTTGGSLTGTVSNPNLRDVIEAAATQIYMTENYTDDVKLMPNVAFVNPYDYFEFASSKTSDGDYVYPQIAGLEDGIPIVKNPYITKGQVLVADMTKLRILNYIDYSVRLGYINAQFIDNEFTMVGETRYFDFIKLLDQKAFVYDAIADIVADINKP